MMHSSINTILVTTDFSGKSGNAVTMASHMAARHAAHLILFHTVNNYFMTDRTGKQVISSETVQDHYLRAEQSLKDLENSLRAQHPQLNIEILIKNDTLIAGLNEIIGLRDVDVVISGTSGTQKLKQLILGSMSYEILTGAHCSVMLVPETWHKHTFENILVPVRILDNLTEKLDLSMAIAKKNRGVISLLGICAEHDIPEIKSAYLELQKTLAENTRQYHAEFMITRDKAIRISEFSRDDQADLIILNDKDEDSWKSFFSENFFKQMVNNTDVPLFFFRNKNNRNTGTSDGTSGFDITLPIPG